MPSKPVTDHEDDDSSYAIDLGGIVLIIAGTIIFLSLVSYSPTDVPAWLPFSTTAGAAVKNGNFLGIFGAIIAFTLYSLFGAAAYLFSGGFLAAGAAKLFNPDATIFRRMHWFLALMVVAAALADVQPFQVVDAKALKLAGEGGLAGTMVGREMFEAWFNSFGAILILLSLYFCCLAYLVGSNPVQVLRMALRGPAQWLKRRPRETAENRRMREPSMALPLLDRDDRGARDARRPMRPLSNGSRMPQPSLDEPGSEPALDMGKASTPSANGTRPERRSARAKPAPPPVAEETVEEELVIRAADIQEPDERPVREIREPRETREPKSRKAEARTTRAFDDGADVAEESGDEPFQPPAPPVPVREPEPPRPRPQIIDSAALPSPMERARKKDRPSSLQPVNCENYQLPSFDLLDAMDPASRQPADPAELIGAQNIIIETLQQFGIDVTRGDITRGPSITRYEVYPAKGVRVDKIVSLERDLARATRAERINILAPIPGKDTVGIEIANQKKTKVTLREILESDDFQNTKAKLPLALGKDVYGKTILADLAAMPHGLVAGTTGSGKSVCINAIIASLLYRFTPEDLRFIMIDPKVVEMQVYNTLPHLVLPVVTDPKKVLLALRWVIDEMEKRYKIFAKTGVRNMHAFNSRPPAKSKKELDDERAAKEEAEQFEIAERESAARAARIAAGEILEDEPMDGGDDDAPFDADPEMRTSEEKIASTNKITVHRDDEPIIPARMPYIVVIVDELADLMQTAPADVESAIARITQMARAAGIHMIVATQTPRADIVTGVIKANIPTRIAFQVASKIDSRVILDENGAERLLGQGDMLYLPPGSSKLIRSQGVLVTDEEIRLLVEWCSSQSKPAFDQQMQERLQGSSDGDEEEVSDEDEDLVEKCLDVMRQEKKASTSLFQRRLRLGYTRAARILDILEDRGYVGPGEGAKPREILVDLDRM